MSDNYQSEFVGRAEQLKTLRSFFDLVSVGEGQVVFVSGEAGIGKTRLVREVLADMGVEPKILHGQCVYHEGSEPYLPFIEALRPLVSTRRTPSVEVVEHLGLIPLDDEEEEEEEEEDVFTLSSTLAFGLIPEVRSSAVPTIEGVREIDFREGREQLFETVTERLREAGRDGPVILFLDDLHWADPASLHLLTYVAHQCKDFSLMLVGTFRPEDLDDTVEKVHPLQETLKKLGRDRIGEVIELDRLTGDEIHLMVKSIVSNRFPGIGDENAEAIAKLSGLISSRTGGNPFFIEELIRSLAEEGNFFTPTDEGFWAMKDPSRMAIPSTVKDVINRRILRLDEDALKVLRFAAVLGKEFDFQTLLLASSLDEDTYLDTIDTLVQVRILTEIDEDNEAYGFDNMVIQEIIYENMSPSRRRLMHKRVGLALQQRYSDSFQERAAEMAQHFFIGQDWGTAFSLLVMAGEKAAALYAMEESNRVYSQAEVCLDHRAEDDNEVWRAEIRYRLAQNLATQNRWEDALRGYQEALELAIQVEDDRIVTRCLNDMGNIQFTLSEWHRASALFSEALQLATQLDEKREVAESYRGLGRVAWRLGCPDEAVNYFNECVSLFMEGKNKYLAAVTYIELGNVYNYRGDLDQASQLYADAIRYLERIQDTKELARAYNNLGDVMIKQGEFKKAVDLFQKATSSGPVNRRIRAWALMNMAEAYARAGDLSAADAHCRQALEETEQLHDRMAHGMALRNLGMISSLNEEMDEARDLFEKAINIMQELGTPYEIAITYREMGEMYVRAGEPDAARKSFQEALDVWEGIGAEKDLDRLRERLSELEAAEAQPA